MNRTYSKTASPNLPEFANNRRKTTSLDGSISQSYNWCHLRLCIFEAVWWKLLRCIAWYRLHQGRFAFSSVTFPFKNRGRTLRYLMFLIPLFPSVDKIIDKVSTTLSRTFTLKTLITIILIVQPVPRYRHHVYQLKPKWKTLVSHLHIWVWLSVDCVGMGQHRDVNFTLTVY